MSVRSRRLLLSASAVAIACTFAGRSWAEPPATGAPAMKSASPTSAATKSATTLFDPNKDMLVSEVRPGMTGYGISVFKGTKLERFNVQVVSVLKNFNPKDDVVLIRCTGENLEHTGAVAGMSGSPIYLKDDRGRERMIGAFAYGWPLAKDPIAGVQPIQYMLALPVRQKDSTAAPGSAPASMSSATSDADAAPLIHWKLSDAIPLPGMRRPPAGYPLAALDQIASNRFAGGDDSSSESSADAASERASAFGGDADLQPLATPLMTAGLSPKLVDEFAPLFRAYGLTALQAGGGAAMDSQVAAAATQPAAALMQPGSVLAAPLLTGDADMTAIGTCTDVVGDRVFGFGHPFNNEGSIDLPFGAGEINAIVAELQQSFKLGAMTRTIGTLTTDRSVGIAGRLGAVPRTMPIDLHIVYADGSVDQHYHFECVIHQKFTPLLSTAALAAALTGEREVPENHTLDFDLNIGFANGRSIKIANVLADDNPASLFLQLAAPLAATIDNPFAKVMPDRISGTVRVISENRTADVLSVNLPKLKYKPGETVLADVEYRPFRGSETTLPIEMPLPRDLPDGSYQLVVSGWDRYITDELTSRPFRFNADNISELFDVLKDFESLRRDAVYVRLVRQADGVALGRTAMPRLPSSIRQVMLNAGRSDTTAFVSSTVRIIPTKLILAGAADFAITIQTPGHVERAPRPEMPAPMPAPPGAAAPKPANMPGAAPAPQPQPQPPK